jgi:hydroxymethylbilane synthase
LRRTAQLIHLRPDLQVCSLRGNIDTRLRKVYSGEVDGAILAAAALLRLDWEDKITEYLSLEHFLPSVGQGALVIEARTDDKEIANLVSPLNHPPTWQSVMAERAFLRTLGSGCRAPIAALGIINSSTLKLEGMIASPKDNRILRNSEEGSIMFPEKVGIRLAQKMLATGASDIIAEVTGQ